MANLTIWAIHKGRPSVYYTALHCLLLFNYFSVMHLMQQNVMK